MSFFEVASYFVNPKITLYMNDIMFIMILCFYVGRLYERKKIAAFISNPFPKMGIQYRLKFTEQPSNPSPNILMENQDQENQWAADFAAKDAEEELHVVSSQRIQQKQSGLEAASELASQPVANRDESQINCLKVFDCQLSNSRSLVTNQKQLKQTDQPKPQNQFLQQKVKLEGQKIMQRGQIYINFETSKENSNIIRKIEKHEIITDYILKKGSLAFHYGQLVPLKKQLPYSHQNHAIEVEYFQKFNGNASLEPIVQKRIIELNEKSEMYVNSLIEHGKFRKLYRNIVKIGEGGFGTVYQAYHMLQSKKYAIKKIFINKMSRQIGNLLNEIKILNSLSHPNVVKYNSCWLEYAEFNEHKEYQRMLQGLQKNQNNSYAKNKGTSLRVIETENQQSQVNSQQYEQSYISDESNAFSFIRSSKQPTKKSIPRATKLVKKQQQSGTGQSDNNFGLLPVIYMQMELCEHSLAYYIRKRDQIDRVFCFEIMAQLISGVGYIHFNRIIHRDLKPENILFTINGETLIVKIGDFGLAVQMEPQGSQKSLMVANTRAGTPSYIAPELYESSVKKLNEEDLQKTDIYSLAVIYYEMLNKFSTSHERGQKLSLLKHGKVAGINQFKQQKKLIYDLIKKNRPKAKQILQTQNWKKLSQTICKIKRKQHKNYCVKKQSCSTNQTSNYQLSESHQEGTKKQISKSRTKEHKSRHREAFELKRVSQQDSDHNGNYIEIEANRDNEQNDQEEDVEQQMHRHNIQLIKRSSSRCLNGHASPIGNITEEQSPNEEEHTHPELQRQMEEQSIDE